MLRVVASELFDVTQLKYDEWEHGWIKKGTRHKYGEKKLYGFCRQVWP